MISGKVLQGHPVNSNKFQGVTTLNQIEDYGLKRPSSLTSVSSKSDELTIKASELHNAHQRRWDKARFARAADYSGYIEAVEYHGRDGGTPAVTLWYGKKLDVVDEGLVIPYSAILTAIDGETQTEARFLLRDRNERSGDNTIAITLYHGISSDAARQILHDYNAKAHPVTERETAAFNKTGALSVAIESGLQRATFESALINRRGAKATKKTKVASSQLLICAAGYQLNGQGSTRNVSASDLARMNDAGAPSVPPTFSEQLSTILGQARNNPIIGASPMQVWQIAGVLLSKNRQANSLNWAAANAAYAETLIKGRGGVRLSVKERLQSIESVM